MSDGSEQVTARWALATLDRLCQRLGSAADAERAALVRVACRCALHPALDSFAADPLRRLDRRFPSVDARREALEARRAALPEGGLDVGLLWAALLVGDRAVPCRVAAVAEEEADGPVAVQPVSEDVARAAQSAFQAACAVLGSRAPAGVHFALDFPVGPLRTAENIQGDSLGLPLALAFLSAAHRLPIPSGVGATGAVGRRFATSLDPVGGVEAKVRALAHCGVACLFPEAGLDLGSLAAVVLEGAAGLLPRAEGVVAPAESAPLYGRAVECAALSARLRSRQGRLVTLTGPGGVGKTRLALRVARGVADAFADGVRFVPLDRGAGDVERALREALGLAVTADLASALATSSLLLVLDNGETVDQGIAVVSSILQAAPGVVCLATARSPLGLTGEMRFEVHPLAAAAALALFCDRAAAADADFVVEGNETQLKEICRRLDGLPLAIEIAAAWARYMTVEEMAERLARSSSLLVSRVRDIPARQRTVRAALESSYALLEPEEARSLAWLSVFSSPFSCDDAAAVLGGAEALAGIARLEERSLLRRQRSEQGVWFSLLSLVREFAGEKLAQQGALEAARDAHAARFAFLASRLGRRIDRPSCDRLEAAMEDLRRAFLRLQEQAHPALPGFIADLAPFLRQRGFLREQEEWPRVGLDQLAAGTASPDPRILSRLHLALAVAYQDRDAIASAESHAEAAYAAARLAGAPDLLGDALATRGVLHTYRGRFDAATADHDRARDAYRRAGDPRGEAASLNNRAVARMGAQRIEMAAADLEAAIALARAAGALQELAHALNNLACLQRQRGERENARRSFAEFLTVSRGLKNAVAVAVACRNLAEAALGDGNREAGALLARAERIFARLGHPMRHEAAERLDRLAQEFGAAWVRASRGAVADWSLERLVAEESTGE